MRKKIELVFPAGGGGFRLVGVALKHPDHNLHLHGTIICPRVSAPW